MAKPTGTDLNTTWGESANASVLEPSGAKQGLLFQGDERPAAQYFNWFLRTVSRWLGYVRDFETFGHYWDALQVFRGAAGDDNAAMVAQPTIITTRKLIFEMAGGTSGRKVRFYRVSTTGNWEVTHNAYWRASDSKWVADANVVGFRCDSTKLVLSDIGPAVYRPATSVGSAVWNESDWEKITWGPDDGRWTVISPTTGAGGSNPAATEAITNQLRAKNIPKAWGTISKLAGANPVVLNGGFNIASVSGTSDILQVNFAAALADEDYAVVIGSGTPPAWGACPIYQGKAADHFHLAWVTVAGGITPVDLDAPAWQIDFVVFGKQS